MDVLLSVLTDGQRLDERKVRPWLAAVTVTAPSLNGDGTVVEFGIFKRALRSWIDACLGNFNVSPKLAHSGLRRPQRIRPVVLRQFVASGKAVFKFVARDLEDLDEISEIVAKCDLAPVWVMPEGCDRTTVLTRMQALAAPVIARGWNLTPRLHVLLWEDQRAR